MMKNIFVGLLAKDAELLDTFQQHEEPVVCSVVLLVKVQDHLSLR